MLLDEAGEGDQYDDLSRQMSCARRRREEGYRGAMKELRERKMCEMGPSDALCVLLYLAINNKRNLACRGPMHHAMGHKALEVWQEVFSALEKTRGPSSYPFYVAHPRVTW